MIVMPCGGNGREGYGRMHTYVGISKRGGLVCCFPPEYIENLRQLNADVRVDKGFIDCPHCRGNYTKRNGTSPTPDEISRERRSEAKQIRAFESALEEGLARLGVKKN